MKRIIYIAILILTLVSSVQASLVDWWKMDQSSGTTVTDSAGASNGAFVDVPVWTSGKIGNALQFDGSNDAVQITGKLGSLANLSVTAWANMTATDTSGAEIFSIGDYFTLRGYNVSTTGVRGSFYDGGSFNATDYNVSYLNAGWHHFAYTFDDTGNSQVLYVDGVARATSSYSASISYTGLGTDSFIGQHGNGSTAFNFTGKIDDVRVYNTALTAAEVREVYAQGAGAFTTMAARRRRF